MQLLNFLFTVVCVLYKLTNTFKFAASQHTLDAQEWDLKLPQCTTISVSGNIKQFKQDHFYNSKQFVCVKSKSQRPWRLHPIPTICLQCPIIYKLDAFLCLFWLVFTILTHIQYNRTDQSNVDFHCNIFSSNIDLNLRVPFIG